MASSRKVPRYAHSEGHTGLCYSADGTNLITCGSEGDIRIWNGFEDDDPAEKCVGERTFVVAQVEDKLYVGTDHNNVQAFTFPGIDIDRICTRFTAPVTCISIVKDWLVAGSSDMTVHLFNLSSGAEKVISDNNGPILEVALDPQLEYLATSCCDGLVRVYNMEHIVNDIQSGPVQTWNDFIVKSNDFDTSPVSCSLSWSSKDGQYLAIPHNEKVLLFNRQSWSKYCTLAYDECNFQIVRFSQCGLYLAGGGDEGAITVWNVTDKSILHHSFVEKKKKISALAWNPTKSNEIAYCDKEGQLGLIEISVSEDSPLVNGNGHLLESDIALVGDDDELVGGDDELVDTPMDEDEDDDNVISIDKIKSQSGFVPDDERVAPGSPSSMPDIDEASRQTPMSGMYHSPKPETEVQPAFQPTSTPSHFQHRFMVYNDYGMVRHTNTDEENSIDVEFHDSSIHHSFRIHNVMGHSIAALSNKALVLACERDEDRPSKVSCIVMNSWDGSKEWSMDLSDEDIVAVAASDSFIAVASDKRLLRIFSFGGCQREVISLPGSVVCLNANSRHLVAICHAGVGLPGDQNLCYVIYNVGALHRTRGPFPLPMSPKTTLKWAGFSEEGSFMTLDSDCVLRLCQGNNVWRPVCFMDDLTKGRSDHYFVVGVTESSHTVRCILCKGTYYPATVPRPILTQVSWKIPLCESHTEKTDLEEHFWRKQLALSNVPSDKLDDISKLTKEIIAPAVKLFALSCKTDNDLRAIELCELFSNPQFLQLAMRYSTSTGKTNLAEKISELNLPSDHISQRSASPEHYSESQNNGQHNQSRDMFGDDTFQHPADTSNIILAMKEKQVVIKPEKMVRLNPFKRNVSKEKNKSDIISELSQKSQEKSTPVEPLEEVKVSKEKKSKPQIKFTEWFSKEKENLENEFPELDKTELNKMAMKRFKEINGQQKNLPQLLQANSVKNFFSRKPTSETQTRKDTENSLALDSTVIPSSQEVIKNNDNENLKKRKSDDQSETHEPNAKKPLTAVNKLKAFSFNK